MQSASVSRAPASNQLDYGELAINYNSADPQLFIKDSSGSVLRLFDYYAKVSGSTFTGDVNFDGELTIQGDSTNGSGQLTLTCEQNTHAVKIKAPAHSAAANYTLTLPSSTGSNTSVLTTDGSGNLSWALSSMSTADKNKLDGIESGATADQTGAEIKSLYEAESNTNAFTDAEKVKLSGVAAGAEVNVGTNLSYTATSRLLSSSTGGDVNLPEATPSQPGLLSAADKTKLNAIETSATADQTATEILTAIRTVDGSGSGLDADTVDGLESSRITRNSGGLTTNLDTFYDADMFGWATNATGRPESYGQGISIVSSGRTHNNANNWITQLAFGTSTTQAYFRTKVNSGGWTSWHKIWNSANDGAGSGLDADLLDGINSNSFLRSDQSDTMNGELNVTRNSGVTGASPPSYSQANIELQTSSNNVPAISFHRGGYSATTLYEYDGELFINAWVSRSQNGKLVSSGNIGSYAYTSSNDGSGSGLDADLLDGVQGSSFLRSDANDTFTGNLSNNGNNFITFGPNSSWGNYLRIGGNGYQGNSSTANIAATNGNLHIDASNGSRGTYINYYAGTGGIQFGGGSHNVVGSVDSSGNLSMSGNVTAYSDLRLKENIEVISNALDKVKTLRGVTYNRTDMTDKNRQSGVIAQEVEKVLPEVVQENNEGIKSVAYGNMIGLVIEAIKELANTVDSLSLDVQDLIYLK